LPHSDSRDHKVEAQHAAVPLLTRTSLEDVNASVPPTSLKYTCCWHGCQAIASGSKCFPIAAEYTRIEAVVGDTYVGQLSILIAQQVSDEDV
jgi:hypothetical protein